MIKMSPGSPKWRINMYWGQNWWQQQQKKKAEEAKMYKPPTVCTFCHKKIEDGDFFYGGYDQHKIYSETCDHIRCHQWLVQKIRKKRIDDKTIR